MQEVSNTEEIEEDEDENENEGEEQEDQIEDAFVFLRDHGRIKYDSVISRGDLEEALCVSKQQAFNSGNPWAWQGPFLALKMRIEKEGFFTTQRGVGEGLKILPLEMMPLQTSKINDRIKRRQGRTAQTMRNANYTSLDEIAQKRHLHALNTIVEASKAMTSVLRRLSRELDKS